MNIILQTPRLILRRFTDSDADAELVFHLNSDPEVLKYLHEPLLTNTNHAREIIRTIILPQYGKNLGRWAVNTKSDNEFIGWCGLKYLAEEDEIDLGYRFKRSSWGKGYATEAAKNTLDFGLNKLGLKSIVGRALIENTGSINVLQKAGMEYIGEDIINDAPHKVFIKQRIL
jgi:ribosomal-protein-alanine N-acetyltransferase